MNWTRRCLHANSPPVRPYEDQTVCQVHFIETAGHWYDGHFTPQLTLWSDGIVPLQISPEFTDEERNRIDKAIADYEDKTCIHFVIRTGQENYIDVSHGDGYSFYSDKLGMVGGRQNIGLPPGCLSHGKANNY